MVKIGKEKRYISSGVPQYSILRPIVSLLYINDIKNSSLILKLFLFADDTSTLLINKDIKKIEKTYNKDPENVKNWLDSNKLSLNVDKSNLVLFPKNKKNVTIKLNIKIMGEQLKEKGFTKYLGILIDNKLTWPHHINPIKLKISKGIVILTKLKRFLSRETLRMLFFTFIQPHVDYGLLIWGGATASDLKPIQSKLKEAIRKMSFFMLLKQHKILNFEKQKTLSSACFMLRVANKEASSTITGQVPLKGRVYGDKNLKFHIPSARSKLLERNIIYQSPKLWNSTAVEICCKKSIQTFKAAYLKKLLDM